jgi:hypothetical protein
MHPKIDGIRVIIYRGDRMLAGPAAGAGGNQGKVNVMVLSSACDLHHRRRFKLQSKER